MFCCFVQIHELLRTLFSSSPLIFTFYTSEIYRKLIYSSIQYLCQEYLINYQREDYQKLCHEICEKVKDKIITPINNIQEEEKEQAKQFCIETSQFYRTLGNYYTTAGIQYRKHSLFQQAQNLFQCSYNMIQHYLPTQHIEFDDMIISQQQAETERILLFEELDRCELLYHLHQSTPFVNRLLYDGFRSLHNLSSTQCLSSVVTILSNSLWKSYLDSVIRYCICQEWKSIENCGILKPLDKIVEEFITSLTTAIQRENQQISEEENNLNNDQQFSCYSICCEIVDCLLQFSHYYNDSIIEIWKILSENEPDNQIILNHLAESYQRKLKQKPATKEQYPGKNNTKDFVLL